MKIFIKLLFPIVFSLNLFADVKLTGNNWVHIAENSFSPPTPDTIDQYNITMSCEPEYIYDTDGKIKAETICLEISAERIIGEDGFISIKLGNSDILFNLKGSPVEHHIFYKNSKVVNMEKYSKAISEAISEVEVTIRTIPTYHSKICSTQFVASQVELHTKAYEKCEEAVAEKKFDSNGLSWTK